jgi:hypothetical protein
MTVSGEQKSDVVKLIHEAVAAWRARGCHQFYAGRS